MADDLTAALEEIRAEADGDIAYRGSHDCPDVANSCSAHNTLRLLAAIEAALKEAGDWDTASAKAAARTELNCEDGLGASLMLDGRAQALKDCARSLREAISLKLSGDTGKEAGDG